MTARNLSVSALSLPRSKKRHAHSLLLMLFNSVDAYCTLVALDNGAEEMNAIMAHALAKGILYFLFIKLLVVNVLILFVGVIGQHYRVGRIGLNIAVWAYALLTCYHLLNLSLTFGTSLVP